MWQILDLYNAWGEGDERDFSKDLLKMERHFCWWKFLNFRWCECEL